jgi:Recombination endonuclease VII
MKTDSIRICKGCKEPKDVKTEFYLTSRGRPRSRYCRKCYTANGSEHKRTPQGRSRRFFQRYGITLQDYDRMLQEQNGGCAICHRVPQAGERRLAVDHDHVTKKVRGLLCAFCNIMIGRLYDDPAVFAFVIEYLKRGKETDAISAI